MAVITSAGFYRILGHDYPVEEIGGSIAPVRLKEYFLDFQATADGDTIDLNAVVDKNINAVEGMDCVLVDGTAYVTGTALTTSGTSLVAQAGGGRYKTAVKVSMK